MEQGRFRGPESLLPVKNEAARKAQKSSKILQQASEPSNLVFKRQGSKGLDWDNHPEILRWSHMIFDCVGANSCGGLPPSTPGPDIRSRQGLSVNLTPNQGMRIMRRRDAMLHSVDSNLKRMLRKWMNLEQLGHMFKQRVELLAYFWNYVAECAPLITGNKSNVPRKTCQVWLKV